MSCTQPAENLDPGGDGVVKVRPIGCCIGFSVDDVRPAVSAARALSNEGPGDEAASTVPKLTYWYSNNEHQPSQPGVPGGRAWVFFPTQEVLILWIWGLWGLFQLFLAIYSYLQLLTAIYCYLLLFIAIYCYWQLFTAVYCYLLLFTAVYCYLLLFTAIYCCLLLSTAVYCYLQLFINEND